jgi:nucleotide-binding universal stress UspA family protein
VKLASTLDLPVYLVRVVDVDREEIICGEARPDDFKHEATAYLTGQVARLEGQGLVVNHEVRTGNPVSGLLHVIRPGDIVVMTSHGRGGSLRRLLGSVAEELVRRAAAPVLLVPSAGRDTTVDATHSRSG